MARRSVGFWVRTTLLTITLAACASDDTTDPGGGSQDVNQYLSDLPRWDQFAPPGVTSDSTIDSTRTVVQSADTVPVVNAVDSLGNVITRQNVAYSCTAVPYSIAKNPRELVLYNPDVDILWPGALIQGKSHEAKVGSLLPLTIAQRAPVNVSIPGFSTGTNFRVVDIVDQAHVGAAIGSIVGNATATGLQAAAASTFEMRSFSSEQEFALQAGLSGKYLGFSGSASGSFSRNSSEATVAVHFYQRMYDVVVAPPQTPGAIFSEAFTPALLEEQRALGRIGSDNLPIYVSQVTYGRMMMFTLTSTASESEIRATLNASYKFVTGQAGFSLSAKQMEILQQARIAITAIGGNDSATAAMIRSGDWRDYFTSSAPLSTAAPISYTFRNLGDGSIANVTESTDYNIKTCAETSTLPGQFDFLPAQNIASPVSTPAEIRLADVNGDGHQDLVWNHRAPGTNQIAVALGQAGGTFGTPFTAAHPVTAAEGWGNFVLTSGDFSGDGKTDLAWSYFANGTSKTYVALSTGTGWTFGAAQVRPETVNWTGTRPLAADTDGDGDADLVFSLLLAVNHTYVNLSHGDGTFDMSHGVLVHPLNGWSHYQPFVGDLNQDGRADLIWNSVTLNSPNRTYVAMFNADGHSYTLSSPQSQDHYANCCWSSYQRLVGDFNGDGRTDLYFSGTGATPPLHGARSVGTSGSWSFLNPYQRIALVAAGPNIPEVGDIDGDGFSDIVYNHLGPSTNVIQSARGKNDGFFEVTLAGQTHPAATNWGQAGRALMGDVNHDLRDDIVWVIPGVTMQVYVALARP